MTALGERARAAVLAYEAALGRERKANERALSILRRDRFRSYLRLKLDLEVDASSDNLIIDEISLRLDQDGSDLEVGLRCSVCRTAVWRAFKTLLELGYWLEQVVSCDTCGKITPGLRPSPLPGSEEDI